MNPSDGRPQYTRAWLRWSLRRLERCLAIIGLLVVVNLCCFHVSRVTTESMEPTLFGRNWNDADRILTENVSYLFRHPNRWEIVTFRRADGGELIKRVIGLPGERIKMLRGGRIFINGEELPIPDELKYLRYFPFGNLTDDQEVDCGEGYFMLGDDSRDSDDSRFNGVTLPNDLIGRAWYVYYPREHRGFIRR